VLPGVFYAGTRRWDKLRRLTDLMEMSEHFFEVTPTFEPLFVNLGATLADRLESAGGFFGRTLRLAQNRRTSLEEFQPLLGEALGHLASMARSQRLHWLEFLSYIMAWVHQNPRGFTSPESRRPGLVNPCLPGHLLLGAPGGAFIPFLAQNVAVGQRGEARG
jgi:hypothetical protein